MHVLYVYICTTLSIGSLVQKHYRMVMLDFFFIDSHLDSLQCDVYIVPFSSCYFYFDYMIQEFKDAKLGVTVTKRDTFSTHIDHSNPLCEATIHLFDWNCIRNGQSWMHNDSWILCKF